MSRSSKKPGPAKRVQILKDWMKSMNLPKPRKRVKEDEDGDLAIDYSSYFEFGKRKRF